MSDRDNHDWINWMVGFFIGLTVLVVLFSDSKPKTDGIFESATEKLDKGRPLNQQERQRIEDILNWSKKK